MKLYRGTQRPEVQGRQKLTSWTPSKSVAVVYASRPGRIGEPAKFVDDSTLHEGTLKPGAKILEICGGDTWCSFGQVLEELKYGEPNGATDEDARKILNYMHNRYVGKVPGGEFKVSLFDEDGNELGWSDWGMFSSPISWARDDWDDEGVDMGDRLLADTYIFSDAPATRRVAKRLGYDALLYYDIFAAGIYAAEDLLGCDKDDVDGVEYLFDVEHEIQPVHTTIRVLEPSELVDPRSYPVADVLDQVRCDVPAANPSQARGGDYAKLKRKLMRS